MGTVGTGGTVTIVGTVGTGGTDVARSGGTGKMPAAPDRLRRLTIPPGWRDIGPWLALRDREHFEKRDETHGLNGFF